MAEKILVTYASKCGSTAEVAAEVAKVLAAGGTAVEVHPVEEVRDLHGYGAVVLGSAVRMGKPLSEARDFLKKHVNALAGVPAAYFTLGATLKEDTPANREKAAVSLAVLGAIKEPVSSAAFAGKVEHAKLPAFWRFLAARDKSGTMAEGDYRDWGAIRAWAESLRPLLLAG